MINDELITKLSSLARLKFNNESKVKIKQDLEKILKMIEKLSEINTDNVDPLIYLSNEINSLREDDVSGELNQKDALKNAPQKDSDYFKVPTVLKKNN